MKGHTFCFLAIVCCCVGSHLEQTRKRLCATVLGYRAVEEQLPMSNEYFDTQPEFIENPKQLLEQFDIALTKLECMSVQDRTSVQETRTCNSSRQLPQIDRAASALHITNSLTECDNEWICAAKDSAHRRTLSYLLPA